MAASIQYISDVVAHVTIPVGKADYATLVEKELEQVRKRVSMPGFRAGKAPKSIVAKQYGLSVKVDIINRLVGEQLYAVIGEQGERNLLGQPMPVEGKQVDIEKEDDLEFVFELAFAPAISVALGKEDRLPYYRIEASEEIIDNQVQQILNSYGEQIEGESVEPRDIVRGVLLEQGVTEGEPLSYENAILMPEYISNEGERAKFVGATKDAVVTFTPSEAYNGNEAEIASLLNIKKEEVAPYIGKEFTFTITKIGRHKPAELNEEFFTKAFGEEGDVRDEAALKEQIRNGLREQFDPESDFKFLSDVRELIIKKAGAVEFPIAQLERWIKTQDANLTDETAKEAVERELPQLIYNTVRDQILRNAQVAQPTEDELRAFARIVAKSQFASYGMSTVPDELLDNFSDRILQDKNQRSAIEGRVVDNKFAAIVKELVSLDEQTISPEDFGKLVNPEA